MGRTCSTWLRASSFADPHRGSGNRRLLASHLRYADDERPSLVTTRAIEIDAYSNAQILCVGDVMLDRFVYGGVQRISPEAPVQVVKVSDSQAMAGGMPMTTWRTTSPSGIYPS
jgi:hypothetical protein